MHFIKRITALALIVVTATSLCMFMDASPSYSVSKVTAVELTNVGDLYTIKKGKHLRLRCSVDAISKKYKAVRWKSSNKKVVTVSSKGTIRARKRGVAYVTVFAKHNKRIRDKVKIRVGYPVTSIRLDKSTYYVEPNDTVAIASKVYPKRASYKKLSWTSSDPEIASISQEGVVTGNTPGTVTITARSNDGRGRRAQATVNVVYIKKGDAQFIAHRGYSSVAPENTLPAFEQAAINNFDGAEMDIWESPNGEDDIDLMVMHDNSIQRMCGVDVPITSVNTSNREDYPIISGNNIELYTQDGEKLFIPTVEEAVETLKKCNPEIRPVIEIKSHPVSEQAITKLFDIIEAAGGEVTIISFYKDALEPVQEEIIERDLTDSIETVFLASKPTKNKIDYCASRGYTGITIKRLYLTRKIVNYAQSKGLDVGSWGINTQAEAAKLINMGLVRLTSNYKVFYDQ